MENSYGTTQGKGRFRFVISGKQAAAFIILRNKHHYSINAIAEAFGRSTSVVWKRLKTAVNRGSYKRFDLRKIPAYVRKQHKLWNDKRLRKYILAWETWVSLDEGEPP